MLVKCIIKVFLYLILAVMTLIHWLLKIPMRVCESFSVNRILRSSMIKY